MLTYDVLATIQITEAEVRFILAEFHNGKLNVLHVERQKHLATKNGQISSESTVSQTIKHLLAKTKAIMGFEVKAVLLAITATKLRLIPRKIKLIDNPDGALITNELIQAAYQKVLKTPIEDNWLIVNGEIFRFLADGIFYKKLPPNQKFNQVTLDIDLLTAPKEEIYQQVSMVEGAGLKVIDIGLASAALAYELTLIKQSKANFQLMIELERERTLLSLYQHGRLVQLEKFPQGLKQIVETAVHQFQLSEEVLLKLAKHQLNFNQPCPGAEVIYLWNQEEQTKSLTAKELYQALMPYWEKYWHDLSEVCQEIIKLEGVVGFLGGEGAEFSELALVVSNKLNITTQAYIPTTLGARDASLLAVLGMFYFYKDNLLTSREKSISVDVIEYTKAVKLQPTDKTELTDSFSSRLKDFFNKGFK